MRGTLWKTSVRTFIQTNIDPTLHRHAASTFHEGAHRAAPGMQASLTDRRGPIKMTLRWFEQPMPRFITYMLMGSAFSITWLVHFVSVDSKQKYLEMVVLHRHLSQLSLDNEAQEQLGARQCTTDLEAARVTNEKAKNAHIVVTDKLSILRVKLNVIRKATTDLIDQTERMERILSRTK